MIKLSKQNRVVTQVEVQPFQNIFDITIQEYGTMEGLFLFVEANNISPTQNIKAGAILNKPENTKIADSLVLNYYKKNKIKPATAGNKEPKN